MASMSSNLARRASESMQASMAKQRRSDKIFSVLFELGLLGVTSLVSIHVMNKIMNSQSPFGSSGQTSKRERKQLLERLNRPQLVNLELNEYERVICEGIVDPKALSVTFDQIGGLEDQKKEIIDAVILPLKRPDLFAGRSSLVSQPRGVLFYGAPGTGKTMLAKAIARESGATFINLKMSTIMNKYFGESNKLVAGVFSLAQKLAPSIVFIDELDSFLRQRGGDESALSNMKAEFMTHWDGLLTDPSSPVMVLGATNRPYDIDQAILRRLPRSFEIGLPTEAQRKQILLLLLQHEKTAGQLDALCEDLAGVTEGYSGSDLKELCRAALMQPIRELAAEEGDSALRAPPFVDANSAHSAAEAAGFNTKCKAGAAAAAEPSANLNQPRPLRRSDFQDALAKVGPTGASAHEFMLREQREGGPNGVAAGAAHVGAGPGAGAGAGATASGPSGVGAGVDGQAVMNIFGAMLMQAMRNGSVAGNVPLGPGGMPGSGVGGDFGSGGSRPGGGVPRRPRPPSE